MKRTLKRLVPIAVVSLVAVGAVAVTAANTHPGRGGALHGASASALVTQAAKELGVTRAKLKDAIVDSARARVDEAVADGDVDKDDAADVKEDLADDLSFAIGLSRTRTVASNLGVSTTKLNDGFREARRTLLTAAINDALADDRIDKDRADELKDELEDADLPGYKGFGPGFGLGFGFVRGLGGFGPR